MPQIVKLCRGAPHVLVKFSEIFNGITPAYFNAKLKLMLKSVSLKSSRDKLADVILSRVMHMLCVASTLLPLEIRGTTVVEFDASAPLLSCLGRRCRRSPCYRRRRAATRSLFLLKCSFVLCRRLLLPPIGRLSTLR